MALAVEVPPRPRSRSLPPCLRGLKRSALRRPCSATTRKAPVVTLRKGSNELICLARDPNEKRFSVACYHKDLEPFMARGRALAAQGLKGNARHEARWKEVQEGKVKMSRDGRMLYVLIGTGYDAAKNEVINPYLRWVVYVPFATPESTGLSTTPGPAPWLMYPGTPGAHIMISPPKPQ